MFITLEKIINKKICFLCLILVNLFGLQPTMSWYDVYLILRVFKKNSEYERILIRKINQFEIIHIFFIMKEHSPPKSPSVTQCYIVLHSVTKHIKTLKIALKGK
jgi:hypothetical protein